LLIPIIAKQIHDIAVCLKTFKNYLKPINYFKMKKIYLAIVFVTGSLFFYACSKQDLSRPATTQQTVASQQEENAITRTNPAPGDYKVKLYIDDNDTSTRVFKGYIFTFSSNGALKATVSNTTFNGEWEIRNGGTELKLRIEGTNALEKIDKSWDVEKITNQQIIVTDNDPGEVTKLIFKLML
jgi:hypothetical protein